jgi:prepilin-type processing-associated H-X9-DG protein
MDTTSPHNSIVWSLGYRLSTLRTTLNAVNTLPGEGITSDLYYPPAKQNGAFGSRHAGGSQFLFGDGRVTFVSENIDRVSYNALATRAGADLDQGGY